MTGFKTVWTQEKVCELRQLESDGLSTAEIAVRMRTTQSAIIGKLYRLGKSKSPRKAAAPVRKGRLTRTARSVLKSQEIARACQPVSLPVVTVAATGERHAPLNSFSVPPCEGRAVTSPSTTHQAAAPCARLPDLPVVEGAFVSLATRRASQCCFPLWPHDAPVSHPDYGRVCGAPVAAPGKPYCADCADKAAGRDDPLDDPADDGVADA